MKDNIKLHRYVSVMNISAVMITSQMTVFDLTHYTIMVRMLRRRKSYVNINYNYM